MQNEKRMSLEDFKLNKIESENEIEKLLGLAAAVCHTTCQYHGNPSAWYDIGDVE